MLCDLMIAQYRLLSHLLFPAQNCYLASSIFRKSYLNATLCNLLFVPCLWKSRDQLIPNIEVRKLDLANQVLDQQKMKWRHHSMYSIFISIFFFTEISTESRLVLVKRLTKNSKTVTLQQYPFVVDIITDEQSDRSRVSYLK